MIQQIGEIQKRTGLRKFYKNDIENTSSRLALRLTRNMHDKRRIPIVFRLTGGFGNMPETAGRKIVLTLTSVLAKFGGSILFGGTRIVKLSDINYIYPTMGEIPPLVKKHSPFVEILGVIPRVDDIIQDFILGDIISQRVEKDQVTCVHPDQTECLFVQPNVDDFVKWDAEWQECRKIVMELRNESNWQSLLIAFSGGNVTEREIESWATAEWPVLLIQGGGGVTENFSSNEEWLTYHPSVRVVEKATVKILTNIIKELILKGKFHAEIV